MMKKGEDDYFKNVYFLIASIKSLVKSKVNKDYLIRIRHRESGKQLEIENTFKHGRGYVYKLWERQLLNRCELEIELFHQYESQEQIVCIRKAQTAISLQCSITHQQVTFQGGQGDQKCILLINFAMESQQNLDNIDSNNQLKQINSQMDDDLKQCKQELDHYQQFLSYTNQVLKELNQGELESLKEEDFQKNDSLISSHQFKQLQSMQPSQKSFIKQLQMPHFSQLASNHQIATQTERSNLEKEHLQKANLMNVKQNDKSDESVVEVVKRQIKSRRMSYISKETCAAKDERGSQNMIQQSLQRPWMLRCSEVASNNILERNERNERHNNIERNESNNIIERNESKINSGCKSPVIWNSMEGSNATKLDIVLSRKKRANKVWSEHSTKQKNTQYEENSQLEPFNLKLHLNQRLKQQPLPTKEHLHGTKEQPLHQSKQLANLYVYNIAAVIYSEDQEGSKYIKLYLEDNHFQTDLITTTLNNKEYSWNSAVFQFERIASTSFLYMRLINVDTVGKIQLCESSCKVAALFQHTQGDKIKLYLYQDRMAVGYVSFQIDFQKHREHQEDDQQVLPQYSPISKEITKRSQQHTKERDELVLPKIKKEKELDSENMLKKRSKRAKSENIQHSKSKSKRKIRVNNEVGRYGSDLPKNDLVQQSCLCKLKERKMRAKAKMKLK